MHLSLVVFASIYCGLVTASGGWSYDEGNGDGPSKWQDDCPKSMQSPIDLKGATYSSTLTTPALTGFNSTLTNVVLSNNGHSIKLELNSGITMSLPNVTGTYKAAQLHFHWGKDDTRGSEHTVDGKKYPMEMHIVTVNTKYADISASLAHTDGLAVLGFFFKAGDENVNFNPIVNALSSIQYSGNSTTISGFELEDLIVPPSALGKYYRYKGSLTTPPCSEVITWTVFTTPLTISTAQLAAFRTDISLDAHMTDNFRPVQTLGSRTLYVSDESLAGAANVFLPSAIMFMIPLLSASSILYTQ